MVNLSFNDKKECDAREEIRTPFNLSWLEITTKRKTSDMNKAFLDRHAHPPRVRSGEGGGGQRFNALSNTA